MMTRQLAIETLIVAATLAAAMAGVAAAAPGAMRGPGAAALTGLALGALFHLGFELSGLNEKYCRVGNACSAAAAGGRN